MVPAARLTEHPLWPARVVHRYVLAASAIVTLAACSAPPGARDADHPTWVLSREPVVSIGSLDGAPEYVFSRIAGVVLLPDRSVAVADGSSGEIRVYGPDGTLRHLMGGEGEGPGDFTYLSGLWFHAPDTLLAYDSRSLRLTTFSTSGRLVSTQAFRADDGYPESYLGTLSDGDHLIAWIRQGPRDDSAITPDSMRVGRFGSDGTLGGIIAMDVGMRRLAGPIPFSPHFLAGMLGDTLVHTDGVGGILRRTGPAGETLPALRVPRPAQSADVAFAELEAALDADDARRLAELRRTPGADTVPVVSELLVADGRSLWVKHYDPVIDSHWIGRRRTGGEWLVVESDGRVIARVPMPAAFRPLDVRGELVAGVTRDELDVERVVVYGLTRN